ncbi:MAG: hypothetical protein KA185_05345 [Vitreoscilla sp.]|nr:hypothetical protein [Vitreoscilla sp.]
MSFSVEIVWLLAGLLVGLLLGFGLGRGHNKVKAQRAKLALADSQQRRALERLSETNRDLKAQVEAASHRQSQTLEAVKKLHATEIGALRDELAHTRQQLMAYSISDGDDRVASPTSFAATQFAGPDSQL